MGQVYPSSPKGYAGHARDPCHAESSNASEGGQVKQFLAQLGRRVPDPMRSKSSKGIACSNCEEQFESTIAPAVRNDLSISIENNYRPPDK